MKHVQLGTGLSSPLRLCLYSSLWGELCISLHPRPRGQQVEVSAGPVPRDEGEAGPWTRSTWPFREWLHPHYPDTGHVTVSELSPCKGSVEVETVTSVKTDSPEILVRETDDMRGT